MSHWTGICQKCGGIRRWGTTCTVCHDAVSRDGVLWVHQSRLKQLTRLAPLKRLRLIQAEIHALREPLSAMQVLAEDNRRRRK